MEEEIAMELEAMQAVYADDCHLISQFPPHLSLHIRPRTADDHSQQFVEIVLGIKASTEYPEVSPHVYIVESKGLDQDRQMKLIRRVQDKARELSSCLMLVALCEEAVEVLSDMNHPEGDCPLCLYPLLSQDKNGSSLPFMKLMSCYHCFHSECIIGYWKWVQQQKGSNSAEETTAINVERQRDVHVAANLQVANCPVCRKVFDEKDFEHVQDYVGSNALQSNVADTVVDEENLLLHSASENERRHKFEALLKLQQENNAIIEPKKDLAIQPGMFLPKLAILPSTSGGTSSGTHEDNTDSSVVEMSSNGTAVEPSTSKRNNVNVRKKNRNHHNSRKQFYAQPARKWIKKGADTTEQ